MNKKHKIFLYSLIFTLIAIVAQKQNSPLLAQSVDADKCYPLDIVIVVDESESMYTGSDVNGRRFDAVGTVIDYLGNHAVFLCREEGVQHRVSVIGFGDRAVPAVDGPDNDYMEDTKIYLDNIIIPESSMVGQDIKEAGEAWGRQRDEISISDEAEQSNLGATDHRSAFDRANDILSEWKDNPIGSGEEPRRQVIMMLTDGGSCVQNRGCYRPYLNDNADKLVGTADGLMNELEDMLDPAGREFPFYGVGDTESVYITTVFLSSNIGRQSFGTSDRWRQVSIDHGGDLYPVTDSTSLVATINDALDPVSGSGRTPIACGTPKWVRPYLDNVIIFSAYPLAENPGAHAVVRIETGDGDDGVYAIQGGDRITGDIPLDNMTYYNFRGNESYIFDSPVPGAYTVFVGDGTDCTDALSIKVDSVAIETSVLSPKPDSVFPAVVGSPYYSDVLNSRFVVEIEDSAGNPLQEIDAYPLQIVAMVRNGDYKKVYELDGQNGRYESDIIETPASGMYEWDLSITVRHPNPEKSDIEVFKDDGSFEASPVELLIFTIDEPVDGYIRALNQVNGVSQIPEPLDIAVTVTNANGDDVDITKTLTDSDSLFTAQLGNGIDTFETITLKHHTTTMNRFVGQFSNGNVDDIHEAGTHTVQVEANWGGTDNYDELAYAPAMDKAFVTIEQYEIVPLQLEMIPPESALLHKHESLSAMFLKQNGLQPFDLSVRIVDAESGEPQFLDDVLTNLSGFEVVVQTRSGITQTIILEKSSNAADQLLVGRGGEALDESGLYTLSMRVAEGQLKQGYDWAKFSYKETFSRQDTRYTKPSTWAYFQILLAAILIGLVVWYHYTHSGGPSGTLIISDSEGSDVISPPLRKGKRKNVFKGRLLKEVGIKRITARKGDGNLISVVVNGTDGHDTSMEMESGDMDVAGEAEVKYVNDQAVASYDDDYDFE